VAAAITLLPPMRSNVYPHDMRSGRLLLLLSLLLLVGLGLMTGCSEDAPISKTATTTADGGSSTGGSAAGGGMGAAGGATGGMGGSGGTGGGTGGVGPADQIEGSPSDPVIDVLPTTAAPLPSDMIDVGPFELSLTRVVLIVQDNATIGSVNSLLTMLGAKIVGGSPKLGLLELDVDAEKPGVQNALNTAAGHPAIAAASWEIGGTSHKLAPAHASPTGLGGNHAWEWDSPTVNPVGAIGGSNWGLKFAKVPYAWNLFNRMRRNLESGGLVTDPFVGIIDKDFSFAHPDLLYHADSETVAPDTGGERHGTSVALMINAGFNEKGIEGILPVSTPLMTRGAESTHTSWLRALLGLIGDYPTVRVINISQGVKYLEKSNGKITKQHLIGEKCNLNNVNCGWWESWAEMITRLGGVWNKAINHMATKVRDDFLITCSAGNDGSVTKGVNGGETTVTYQAQHVSGCNHAGLVGNNDHVLVVEALAKPGDAIASFSQRGGHIAAPGADVGLSDPYSDQKYMPDRGTSFSAPFVAGAAAVVWAVEPTLSYKQVRKALLDSAQAAVSESSVRIDVFAAVLKIDELLPAAKVTVDLADIDDGSVDGNLRADNNAAPITKFFNTTPDGRGDGCVDMADLRTFRDAIAKISGLPAAVSLDGGATHVKLDFNQDGYIGGQPGSSDFADRDFQWSRLDMDADHDIDADDLGLLAQVWGQCRKAGMNETLAPQLEGYGSVDQNKLASLISSTDYWMPVAQGEKAMLTASGAIGQQVDGNDPTKLYGQYGLLTGLRICNEASACQVVSTAQNVERKCATKTNPRAAEDVWLAPAPLATNPPLVFQSTKGTLNDPACSINGSCIGRMSFAFGGNEGGNHQYIDGYFDPYMPSPAGDVVAAQGECNNNFKSCVRLVSTLVNGQYTSYPLPNSDTIYALSGGNYGYWGRWSDDGGRLLVGGSQSKVYLLDKGLASLSELAVGTPKYGDAYFAPGGWVYFTGGDPKDPLLGDIFRITTATLHDPGELFGLPEQCLSPVAERLTQTFGPEETGLAQAVPSAVGPGGRLLVDATRNNIGRFLGIMSGDGSQLVDIPGTSDFAHAAWSPDGLFIAYSNYAGGIHLVEISASGVPAPKDIKVTQLEPTQFARVAFSPIESKWLLAYSVGNQYGEIRVFDTSTKSLHVKLDGIHPFTGGTHDPAWSADGKWIAFTREQQTAACDSTVLHNDVFKLSVQTKAETNLTASFSEQDPYCGGNGGPRPSDEQYPAWGQSVLSPY